MKRFVKKCVDAISDPVNVLALFGAVWFLIGVLAGWIIL